jgi:hypothetical protein
MRKSLVALAATAALLAPMASRASEEEEGGQTFKLGLGIGYSMPFGDARKGESMANLYSGEVPVELELSYKLTHAFSAGVYGGYGYGIVTPSGRLEADVAASGVIQSIATWRVGIQGEYEFGKAGAGTPFLGARVGYVTESVTGKNGWGNSSASGWEWLTLTFGVDFQAARGVAVAPYVSGAIGQYTDVKPAGGSSQSIPGGEQTLHGWLTLGVRGTYGL